ncbi:MAG: PTS lactose/cellobiose transporter subunit IIA [Hespellia sp.]|nr:PTS lactose/cellobiose transporter subunit IIA [Hespellia sp.]
MEQELDMETIGFQMITAAGQAKSCYMEALEAAKNNDFEQMVVHITDGDTYFLEGHNIHGTLISKECSGDKVCMTLFLTHVEDQMASAETTKLFVQELAELYQKMAEDYHESEQ